MNSMNGSLSHSDLDFVKIDIVVDAILSHTGFTVSTTHKFPSTKIYFNPNPG